LQKKLFSVRRITMNSELRIGTGYDVHRLVTGRQLWLGGINIPFEKECLAHSDGDVLLHAICDALLGALALGDLGAHFPDSDRQYKNISSLILLEKTFRMISEKGYKIINIDATIVLQQPRISPYITGMRKNIAQTVKTGIENISVKSTTTEGLGFTGTGDGIAAQAVVLLGRK
jgi:2-C-methyl-D-erythritol 2,4-cyclodiphosphate synthase